MHGAAHAKPVGPARLGARFADPGPAYWSRVGCEMADRFPGSRPQAIWIVGNFSGTGTLLTFPGEFEGGLINFSPRDRNEPALSAFIYWVDFTSLQVFPP